MKYHTLFFSQIRKDDAKFVVCCIRDWRFKVDEKSHLSLLTNSIQLELLITQSEKSDLKDFELMSHQCLSRAWNSFVLHITLVMLNILM